jgi:hypothetical protein
MTTSQITCPCGARYERTEFNPAPRASDRFACAVCGETLEVFSETKVPTYRLISGPLRIPDTSS